MDTRCVFNENGDIKLCIDGHCGRFVGDPWTTEDEYAKDIVMKNASYLDNPRGKLTLNIILNFFWYFRIFDYNCVHCILYARYNSNTKASDTKSYKQFNYIRCLILIYYNFSIILYNIYRIKWFGWFTTKRK